MYRKLIILAGMLFLVYSCDKVEPPYRETSSIGVSYLGSDTVVINGDTIAFETDNTPPVKNVLLEDYTGHTCGNCPYAGILVNDSLAPFFGKRLKVMSVHAGFFAVPCPQGIPCTPTMPAGCCTTDFRTDAGEEWDFKFQNSAGGNPNGLVDRVDYPTTQQVKYPSTWQTEINARLSVSTPFRLRVKTAYETSSREAKIAVQAQTVAAVNGNYKLQVVVTEDSLYDWQVWYPPRVPEYDPAYLHRHVLRDDVNSNYGEVIYDGGIASGAKALRGYSYVLNSSWKEKDCHVLVFIYNSATYEILQTEEVSLKE